MTADLAPGDFVECLVCADINGLKVGTVYRVAKLGFIAGGVCDFNGVAGHVCTGHWLTVEGVHVPAWANGHCAICFKPLYTPKATFLASLTQPAPERETVEA